MSDIQEDLNTLYATREDLENDLYSVNKQIEELEAKLEGEICTGCNGSGEGGYDGTTCWHCKGKGVN